LSVEIAQYANILITRSQVKETVSCDCWTGKWYRVATEHIKNSFTF